MGLQWLCAAKHQQTFTSEGHWCWGDSSTSTKIHLLMSCWLLRLRWECDFAVEHVYKGRTFAPKFGGLWLMRRKHWFELWGQIRRSRGTAQIPPGCIPGHQLSKQVNRNWKPEAKLNPKPFSFKGKKSPCGGGCYLESGEIARWVFLDPGLAWWKQARSCRKETMGGWWNPGLSSYVSLVV